MKSTIDIERGDANVYPEAMSDAEIIDALRECADRINAMVLRLEVQQ